MILSYLNHLNVSGAFEELSELSTIDVKGKVTDEEFKVSREGLLLLRRRQSLIGENVPLFFYVEVVCNRDVADEARRGGGSEDGEGNGLGVEFEGEGRGRREVDAGLEMEKGRDLGLKLKQPWRRKRRDRVDGVKRGLRRILLGWSASLFIHT
ncbi:BnaC07g13620D [Brassica napus]|uniref:BnaC07g13620D protein n=1 Tax=Brassica napus TaxID=3708 RepID=A0A078FHU2_BRANA|nr:BnaC07g13620D [Brassica napus]